MWRKIVALVLIAWSIFFLARGVWHWGEAPLPPNRSEYNYVMSRQIEDLELGVLLVVGAALVYWSWRK